MKKLILCFLILFLLFLSGCGVSYEKYDNLTDRNFELETELDEAKSEIYSIEEKYSSVFHSTEDYMSVLYEYFEEQSVSFDEAYNAYDSLSSILHPYY